MTSFRINRVYTRVGDDGKTALVGGKRVSKADPLVRAFGEVDEINSFLGAAKEELTAKTKELKPVIEFLQQELFDIGSELATPFEAAYEGMWKTSEEHVKHLEKLCDHFNEGLPELKSFILPGGSRLSAAIHVARTVTRRAERAVVSINSVNPQIISYLNRLSDLFFILARWSLKVEGNAVPEWVQEKKRRSPLE